MIRDTSLSAYQDAKKHLNEHQRMVLDFIRLSGEVCDKDVSEGLGWPINCVTNRRGELLMAERIKDVGKRKDPRTGRSVHYWAINEESPKQLEMFAA